ncbi:MAG: hypothetical protein MUE71_11775 [Chitinophagaceae bacterium]|nr:hypothetical protein [Chitinophagaceae bacterium]
MKPLLKISLLVFSIMLVSCIGSKNPKRGCPASDSNLGAERVLAGEGGKKPSKFKVKDMRKSYSQ